MNDLRYGEEPVPYATSYEVPNRDRNSGASPPEMRGFTSTPLGWIDIVVVLLF